MRIYRNTTKITILTLLFLSLGFVMFKINAANSNFNQVIYPITQCNDGVDNDGDGGIDFASDPDCTSWLDDNEFTEITTPTPILTTTPVISITPTSTVIPTPSNSGNILQQISNTINSSTNNALPGLVQKYLWEPLGRILGKTSLENTSVSQGSEKLNKDFLLIICGIIVVLYYLLIVLVIIFYRRKRRKDKK